MATCKKKELIIGGVMLGTALGYLLMTLKLPGHSGIDAAFVPGLLAGMLCLLAVIQLFGAFATPQAPADDVPHVDTEDTGSAIDVKTVVKTLALIVGYIALMNPVGFPIMTAVYLYLQFMVLTPADQKVPHLTYVVIAVITSAVIYLLFREAFDLMLPAGLTNF
ncbi:tripartite tricarboxylate transporter TctB family protein [Pseudomonas syringae]|uniref:tripartite tricarboxylate transporter TctB family protein n=1 Tax=Pseudomonas ovata TaxID=1839709 RepID=UPI000D6974BB|nr:tripartite tricarboxylate transporter TctB family protein [Pseudomonas ovata]MBD8495468.1 tripartite tricarboxylate transporter TctB family protein [Pseudomonas syringae]MBD8573924.1 tripartite tricarboxylate transporter TctB family protein [Pseudomonas syringae]MBD8791327.1 tripartite tricarboxylate transporter TctB family protein [Pseudomonas syringae]MBD8801539.1 tripartite tricarboxylate transporter TctB family protein [Pseudomonas syringae]MBD8810184.1 tripartite tricarboxylate transpo